MPPRRVMVEAGVVLLAARCHLPKRHVPGVLPAWQLASVGEGGDGVSARSAMPDFTQAGAMYSCCNSLLHYATRPPPMAGQKFDEFVDKHFSKTGERNPRTHRWKMRHNYCTPDTTVEVHEHLSRPEKFTNAQPPFGRRH